jgi:hypothetical protein
LNLSHSNKEFFRQLRSIFAIIIPRATAKEVFLLTTHTFFLLLRTYLSLLVAKLDGIIVRDLVSANARGFALGLCYWYALAIPSTYTNSMVRCASGCTEQPNRTHADPLPPTEAGHLLQDAAHPLRPRPLLVRRSKLLQGHQPRQSH